MSLARVKRLEVEADRAGVSTVARGPTGFVGAYASAPSAKLLAQSIVPRRPGGQARYISWLQERENFILRHLPQYRQNPTNRRWLALAMWAYDPGPRPSRGPSRSPRQGRGQMTEKAPEKAPLTAAEKKRDEEIDALKKEVEEVRGASFATQAGARLAAGLGIWGAMSAYSTGLPWAKFKLMDKDGDGNLTMEEFAKYYPKEGNYPGWGTGYGDRENDGLTFAQYLKHGLFWDPDA